MENAIHLLLRIEIGQANSSIRLVCFSLVIKSAQVMNIGIAIRCDVRQMCIVYSNVYFNATILNCIVIVNKVYVYYISVVVGSHHPF